MHVLGIGLAACGLGLVLVTRGLGVAESGLGLVSCGSLSQGGKEFHA